MFTTNTLLIFAQLLSFIYAATPDIPPYTATDTLEGCLSSAAPSGVSRWQNNTSAMTLTVEWYFGALTCSNKNTCYGIEGDHATDPMVPQLVPIEIQQGVNLRFSPSQLMPLPFLMRTYRVTQENFVSCNITGGSDVTQKALSHVFDVDPVFLQLGHNYFIVETDVEVFKCEYGLRLDVLLKSHNCIQDDNSTLCTARGHCHSQRNQEQYLCDCCPGYAGQYCEDLDGCVHSECKNGATCVDVLGEPTGTLYNCSCSPGFNGTLCENKLENMCDTQPCLNNATCSGNKTHFSCLCSDGFRGERCQMNNTYCQPSPCIHGLCVEKDGYPHYQCYCIPGHGGHHCEHEYDECQSDPCKNAGICVDKVNGFSCQCTKGYTGKDCSIKVDLCMPNPCKSGVKCVDFGDDTVCICPQGTSGKHCSVDVDECVSSPCMHGGTCVDKIAGYTCTCPQLTTGLHCEITLDGFVKATSHKEADPFNNQSPSSISGLHVVIGTLGAALFLVLVIVAVMYFRMHKSPEGLLAKFRQLSHKRANRKIHPQYESQYDTQFDFPMDTIPEPYQSYQSTEDAAYDQCKSVEYMDTPLNVPLFTDSLKPKKV